MQPVVRRRLLGADAKVGGGLVHEQPPHAVLGALQALHDGGVGARLGRRAVQVHVGALGGAAALARVAWYACGHQVLPGVATAEGARDHVVDGELTARESLAAVVAATEVASVDVAAGQAYLPLRPAAVAQQPNDPRYRDYQAWRLYPVGRIMFLHLCVEAGTGPHQFRPQNPSGQIVGLELACIRGHHLGRLPDQQDEGPSGVGDTDCRVAAVEDEDARF